MSSVAGPSAKQSSRTPASTNLKVLKALSLINSSVSQKRITKEWMTSRSKGIALVSTIQLDTGISLSGLRNKKLSVQATKKPSRNLINMDYQTQLVSEARSRKMDELVSTDDAMTELPARLQIIESGGNEQGRHVSQAKYMSARKKCNVQDQRKLKGETVNKNDIMFQTTEDGESQDKTSKNAALSLVKKHSTKFNELSIFTDSDHQTPKKTSLSIKKPINHRELLAQRSSIDILSPKINIQQRRDRYIQNLRGQESETRQPSNKLSPTLVDQEVAVRTDLSDSPNFLLQRSLSSGNFQMINSRLETMYSKQQRDLDRWQKKLANA